MLHWDFMMEQADSLRTWRLEKEPAGVGPISAQEIGLHRLLYLDYEGPVSGGRGRVRRWDAGSYELVEATPDRLLLSLQGTRCRGSVSLARDPRGTWTVTLQSADG